MKASFYGNEKIAGFAHFASDAAEFLDARVKLYDIRLPYRTKNSNQAWEAAGKLQQYFTEWIKENMGLVDPRGPHPRVVLMATDKGGDYTLMMSMFLLARDLPVGRNVKEALEDPIAFHPRTKRRKLFYKGKTPVHKKTVLLQKNYAKRSALQSQYHSLILSEAVKVEKGKKDGRYHARLTYWHMDQVQLPKDIPTEPEPNENFDLWGNWKTEESQTFTNNVPLFEQIEEGSGIAMRADRHRFERNSTKDA